jgi:hypothetical protein
MQSCANPHPKEGLRYEPVKDPAAVSLGRRGGSRKVPKGFSKMGALELSELGRAAAKKRWKLRDVEGTHPTEPWCETCGHELSWHKGKDRCCQHVDYSRQKPKDCLCRGFVDTP